MSAVEYNFLEDENLYKGINLQLIDGNKFIISSISDEDYHEIIPNTKNIIIQTVLPKIELMCILNLSMRSAELIGKGVFCRMFSFEELITFQYVDEIKYMPCVKNLIQNKDEELLFDQFLVFCGTITNSLYEQYRGILDGILEDTKCIQSIFNNVFKLLKL